MLHSNQCNKNHNHLPHVTASVLFEDLENLTHDYDHLLKEAYSRFSSFPTAIRRQNLEIRDDYKRGNSDQGDIKGIYIPQCMKVLLLRVRKTRGIKKRVMETIIVEKGTNNGT